MKLTTNKRLFLMAALLASSSAVDLDDGGQEGINIRPVFERQSNAEMVTSDAYRIQIDRVNIDSGEIDVRPRDADDLDRILAQLERPTIDVTPGFGAEPDETELVLTNARFEGRVYDDSGARLPAEGLGISGQIPLNVKVQRTGQMERPVDVQFEVPSRFFDGIDWAV